jgi:hypothetical protein
MKGLHITHARKHDYHHTRRPYTKRSPVVAVTSLPPYQFPTIRLVQSLSTRRQAPRLPQPTVIWQHHSLVGLKVITSWSDLGLHTDGYRWMGPGASNIEHILELPELP